MNVSIHPSQDAANAAAAALLIAWLTEPGVRNVMRVQRAHLVACKMRKAMTSRAKSMQSAAEKQAP